MKASKNPTVDYDLIMKSIKIDHRKSSTSHLTKQPQLCNSNWIDRSTPQRQQQIQLNNQKINISFNNKSQVYSSIVYDDLCKQSCFQSILRSSKLSSESQLRKQQFKFYDVTAEKTDNITHNTTLTKFSITKTKKNYKQIQFADADKQNNEPDWNINDDKNIMRSQQTGINRRYLSHTETSQKKIKEKKVLSSVSQPGIKICSKKREKSEAKKPGIQLIYQKCYPKPLHTKNDQ